MTATVKTHRDLWPTAQEMGPGKVSGPCAPDSQMALSLPLFPGHGRGTGLEKLAQPCTQSYRAPPLARSARCQSCREGTGQAQANLLCDRRLAGVASHRYVEGEAGLQLPTPQSPLQEVSEEHTLAWCCLACRPCLRRGQREEPSEDGHPALRAKGVACPATCGSMWALFWPTVNVAVVPHQHNGAHRER